MRPTDQMFGSGDRHQGDPPVFLRPVERRSGARLHRHSLTRENEGNVVPAAACAASQGGAGTPIFRPLTAVVVTSLQMTTPCPRRRASGVAVEGSIGRSRRRGVPPMITGVGDRAGK